MKEKLNLDTYRFIASFLIIGIHVFPFISINETFDFLFTHVFSRIAVPFFLILTGYFILPKSVEDKKVITNYTKKIIIIYLISILIYIPINIYAGSFHNMGILKILQSIFINGTMYHLWYFPGLILGLWLTYYLIKKCNKKLIITIIILLYLIGLFGDSYYGIIEKVEILKNFYNIIFKIFDYTRNGLFYCPIFLYLGYLMNKTKEDKNYKKNITLSIIFLILMLLEGFTLHYFNLQKHDSMYIFLIPLMYYLSKILINTNNGKNILLRKISTIIYIMHPFFIVIIRLIGKILNITKIIVNNSLINYILVSLTTLLFALTIYYIKKKTTKEI